MLDFVRNRIHTYKYHRTDSECRTHCIQELSRIEAKLDTGPYNDLENQVRYNTETGVILEIYDQPTGPTDALAM